MFSSAHLHLNAYQRFLRTWWLKVTCLLAVALQLLNRRKLLVKRNHCLKKDHTGILKWYQKCELNQVTVTPIIIKRL